MKPIILIIAFFILASNVFGQDKVSVTGARVTETGLYSARVIKKFETPGVTGGTNEGLDSFSLVQATTNVPARIGTRFGFRYTIHGTPTNAPILLTMVGEHPPFKNPKTGKTQTRDEYELQSWIGQTYTSYLFEEEWELIPGKFKFEVWHKGKKLCEQSFMVVSPSKRSEGTVESLLASVAGITNGQTSFELFVPSQLTLKGEPILQDAAMAVVLDKILGHDLFPEGSEARSGGRLYKYRKE